jgi:hypothetical protein
VWWLVSREQNLDDGKTHTFHHYPPEKSTMFYWQTLVVKHGLLEENPTYL